MTRDKKEILFEKIGLIADVLGILTFIVTAIGWILKQDSNSYYQWGLSLITIGIIASLFLNRYDNKKVYKIIILVICVIVLITTTSLCVFLFTKETLNSNEAWILAFPFLAAIARLFVLILKPSHNNLKTEDKKEIESEQKDYPEIAFIGKSKVGKSTLITKLLNLKAPISTTELSKHTWIIEIGKRVNLFDGKGQVFFQQFKVAINKSFICLFLDHNESNNSSAINEARLKEHEYFADEIIGYLDDKYTEIDHIIKGICIFINKKDLWEKDDVNEKILRDFTEGIKIKMKNAKWFPKGREIKIFYHSNFVQNDIANFVSHMKDNYDYILK